MSERRKSLLAQLALLLAGAIWGSGFVVMKNSLDALPVNYLLAFRFTLAAAVLALAGFKLFKRMGKRTVLGGAMAGIVMYIAYSVQTYGLALTTAGKNAFLTAVYVILVPFLYWAFAKRKPRRQNVVAAVLCLVGIGFVALSEDLSINLGDVLTLLCGLLYAIHIVIVSWFTEKGEDVMALTLLQFLFSALSAWIVAPLAEDFPSLASPGAVPSLLYLGLVCTLLALCLQNVGLKYAPASHAALLMSTEAPFGCLFGVLLLDEPFTLRFGIGFALIAAAIIISERKAKEHP